MYRLKLRSACVLLAALAAGMTAPAQTRTDEVLDWNGIAIRTVNAGGAPAPAVTRQLAIVHVSIFDAVNGIERVYTPIHVKDGDPGRASARAAAIEAAYTSLLALFPAQSMALGADHDAALAALEGQESPEKIAKGRAWGAFVANEIVAWRNTDGFNPPAPAYTGSMALGKWRPTPTAFANGLLPSLAYTDTWVIPGPSSFRPAGPPALTSEEYAKDVNEVKVIAEATSTVRTADQTQAARFWQGTASTFWNRAAVTSARRRAGSLVDSARLLAHLNMAMADAIISCWEAKYYFEFWRPITAIRLASTDGNSATEEQASWTPIIGTPAYPEYSSGHASLTGAAHAVLTKYFGRLEPVEGFSEGLPGVVRSWPSVSAAAEEANEARIWGGMHFRFAVRDARVAGDKIGAYVASWSARRLDT